MNTEQMSLFGLVESTAPTQKPKKASHKRRKPTKPSSHKSSSLTQGSLFSGLSLGSPVIGTGTLLTVAEKLLSYLSINQKITSSLLKQTMNEAFGGTDSQGRWNWKQAYNAVELSLVLWVRKYHGTLAEHPMVAVKELIELQTLLPTHTLRSEESVKLQQFSTPLPLAYLVGEAAQITSKDVVLEPSAGTGLLAIWPEIKGASLILNEISEDRIECLKQGFSHKVYNYNAEQIDNLLPTQHKPTVVVMNPPFTTHLHSKKKGCSAALAHIRSALHRLSAGGRLVTLSSDSFSPNSTTWGDAIAALPGKVVFSVGIEGKTYYKHGTTIDTRLTVIDKVDEADSYIVDKCLNLDEIADLIDTKIPPRQKVKKHQSSVVVPITKPSKKTKKVKEDTRPQAKVSFDDVITVDYNVIDWRDEGEYLNDDGIYERYMPQTINIKAAKVHPTKLVESAAMAAIAPPTPTYKPKLPKAVIEQGLLSDAQLESVIYAGNSHEQFLPDWFMYDADHDTLERVPEGTKEAKHYRKAWFNGDGTGVGKGRQCAGIILDNWLKGRRKAVWISKSNALLEDARRDWKALGGDPAQVVPLSKFKQGDPVVLNEGILFLTYATLRSPAKANKCSRVEQIIEWLGEDSDNVIVFDESHAMANAVAEYGERGLKAASQQGLAGLRLQRVLANARFVFVSATGASKLENLSYLERLGLWNSEILPFINREDFLSQVAEGGIAALEVVARDLKAMGLYLARSVSFDGVEYEIIEHELNEAQVAMYNRYADAYQIIYQNIEKALELTGISSKFGSTNGRAKSSVYSRFESTKQRFFGHLITSIKCPTLLKQIEADMKEGKAAVIQLISTDEALLNRRLDEIPVSQWNDINVDITPREYLFDYLINGFPIHQYESFTDDNGNERSQLMTDSLDNPIPCQEALRQRDALIEELSLLPPLPSALDQIINHFGYEAVAEVTGRSKRIIRVTKEGSDRMMVDKRSSSANLAESQLFMDDEKQILVFSQAGGTGRSYHANRSCQNQRPRVHYLLEGGWQADVAIQGLGRTNRSNQAQPPLYRVICTDIKGEKRFTSTIARRLASLGALTKGERKTGNQGLFREEDNLESVYAKQALRTLYFSLYKGLVEGMTLAEFERISGLNLLTKEGDFKAELPPMKTFLNRVLAMRLEDQEILFTTLEMCISSAIEKAKEAGIYEMGVETIKAEKLEVVNRQQLYQDPVTGGTSYAVEIQKTELNRILSLDEAIRLGSYSDTFFAKNQMSNQVAVVTSTTSVVNKDGISEPRFSLTRPCNTTKMRRWEFDNSLWTKVDAETFKQGWEQQIAQEPEFIESTFYLITGVLLPIWKRLDNNQMRIYRIHTEDGERLLGRAVSESAMTYIARSFELSHERTIEDIYESVMNQGTKESLTEKLELRKVLVRGDYRLEIVGHNSTIELQWLKQLGVQSEYVSHKLRAFVPLENAIAVLKTIQESYQRSDPQSGSRQRRARFS
ncbi:strawberry notch-like NTP hydrolase domain-containing protein [Crocosphaera chwakensis]|uniref:Probably methylase/helicase n=1 Tax=Crocosphaera chwakensis CCY0110 TaxID=391612 RepID=A3IS38_9CHRO|nr:strawberry notch family protein [Crocosphaera chwakensis]EAZ90716.1 probably methylase/helicase [Crocosphaera chwakensis CCY0110]